MYDCSGSIAPLETARGWGQLLRSSSSPVAGREGSKLAISRKIGRIEDDGPRRARALGFSDGKIIFAQRFGAESRNRFHRSTIGQKHAARDIAMHKPATAKADRRGQQRNSCQSRRTRLSIQAYKVYALKNSDHPR